MSNPEPEPTPDEPDPSTFGEHADYVRELRQEAAERRTKAREAEKALEAANGVLRQTRERLLALEVDAAARGILADPSDLLVHVQAAELWGEDGAPDPARIKAAATALVERKAHLAPRPAVGGDVDQGARPPGPEPFDFAGMLRSAAS